VVNSTRPDNTVPAIVNDTANTKNGNGTLPKGNGVLGGGEYKDGATRREGKGEINLLLLGVVMAMGFGLCL
jgi:hypothetical protein